MAAVPAMPFATMAAMPTPTAKKGLSEGEVHEALRMAITETAETYEIEISELEAQHKAERAALEAEIEQLRQQLMELHDEHRWMCDALEEAKAAATAEVDKLVKESTNVGNFLGLLKERAKCEAEARARQNLEMQLNEAMHRIEDLLTAQREEQHRARHASTMVNQVQLDAGEKLRRRLVTKESARELQANVSSEPSMTELTNVRINQLTRHIEAVIFGTGRGNLERTQLIMAALLDRPVVQRLLGAKAPEALKAIEASKRMLESARSMLHKLSNRGKNGNLDRLGKSNDNRGTRDAHSQLAFEAIVMALLPDDAQENQLLRTIGGLLGLNWEQLSRAQEKKRKASKMGGTGKDHADILHLARKQRSDARTRGRVLCDEWWHSNTRFDTCVLAPSF